jgi:putative inorganic carbon (HCO3(-)) transporter
VIAVTAILGWWRVAGEKEALSHLCGLALGFLAMGSLAHWAVTRQRLAAAVGLFLLGALPVLSLGLAGTSVAPSKLTPARVIDRLPERKLGLPGLESNGFVNPSALGATALMIAPIAIAAGRRRSQMPRALRIGGLVVTAVAAIVIAVTQARAVWLSLLILAVLAALWLRDPRARLRGLAVAVGLSLLMLLVVGSSREGGIRRLLDEGAFSLTYRAGIWRQGLDRLSESPWGGIGLNHFRQVYVPPDMTRDRPDISASAHAHNIFIQTALDLGVIGFVAYLLLNGLLLALAQRVQTKVPDAFTRDIAAGAALSIVGVHLFGLADAVALGAKVGLFQWFAAGLVTAAAARTNDRPAEGSR